MSIIYTGRIIADVSIRVDLYNKYDILNKILR